VTSLLDEAHRAVEGEEGLGHDAHMALRDDVNRARAELDANLDDGWAEGAHALGMFVCGPADVFEVVKLPRPVDAKVVIAERPAIEPLAETGPAEPWAVLLFDGDQAHIVEGLGDRLTEMRETVSKHGFSDGIDHETFIKDVADLLRRADARGTYARIAIGTSEHHLGELTPHLAEPLRDKVIGRFDAGADWESPSDIREKVEPLLRADETHREAAALRKAESGGVRGLVDTLPMLYERRVETLLIEPGIEHPGVVCPKCRWAAADERGTCPVDGEEMVAHPNLVEWAVEVAVQQGATVLPVRRHNDLADHDSIGAALRF
jgi:peptide chain release factor subunit 1